jgi:molybdopterin molybdotransferase
MLTVAEALAAIVAEVEPLPVQHVPLDEALGLVLAQDAIADLDSPPFDKALMDGYAVRAADLADGRGELHVVEEIVAGQVAARSVGPREAIRIMTGAPIPKGADAVVAVEQTQTGSGSRSDQVTIETTPVAAGRNILGRGASVRAGARVLAAGRLLRSQELGALAELGKGSIRVHRRPRAAVLATGDELVPVHEVPGPGQIRNSNETMLVAQLQQAGCQSARLGIARDNLVSLREKIAEGLKYDLLLLSGGVSAGKLDLVPHVLAEFGVRQVFHKVRMKPGQPLWFGIYDAKKPASSETPGFSLTPPEGRCAVFGLPGNPVSSMVCCDLFARTAVRRMMGLEPAVPQPVRAKLAAEHFCGGNRPTYHPARLEYTEGLATVKVVPWIGSADLCATVGANATVLFPAGETTYAAGTLLDVFPW